MPWNLFPNAVESGRTLSSNLYIECCMSDIMEEYKQLYTGNALSLIRFACRFVDRYSAEDIVQDAFVKLYDRRFLELPEVDLIKLLYVTVRNLSIDQLRHQCFIDDYKTQKTSELSLKEISEYCNLENEIINKDLYQNVQKVIGLLPSKRLEIFNLYYVNGLDSRSIADQLGISHRTVENNLYRALVFIRQHIPDDILFFILFMSSIFKN